MKIKELIQTKTEALSEAIERANDTGVKTEALVKIAEAQEQAQWTEHATMESFIKHLEALER